MLHIISLGCGLLFGFGLIVSGMINPAKVLNFLDVTGTWDATLAFVFAGALIAALPLYQWSLRNRQKPLVGDRFHVPDSTAITPSLISGAALFGAGWGLAGFCPGPGITALPSLYPGAIIFVLAMFGGSFVYQRFFSR